MLPAVTLSSVTSLAPALAGTSMFWALATGNAWVQPIQVGLDVLAEADPAVHAALQGETVREEDGLEMIASENFPSGAVLAALGSTAQNKYAEGYPGKRYYGGCEEVDKAEDLARDRAKELFGAEHANVQPHSGSTANMGVYMSFLKPGDRIIGMALSAGGHLTHGYPVSFSGKLYDSKQYGVTPETGLIDMNQVEDLAREHQPAMIVVGASAYPRDYDYEAFRQIADQVGAFLFVDMAHPAGLIAAGLLSSPLPHAHVVSTTTHKTLRGPRGGMILLGQNFENPWGITVGKKKPRTRMMSEIIDATIMPGIQGGPLMHAIAAKAVAFGEALQESFKIYAGEVIANAQTLAETMMAAGYHVVTDGTDNHLILVDLRTRLPEMTGKDAERLLGEIGITVNANTVPGETRSPFKTSGLRIGTPALTTRGMGQEEIRRIAGWIDEVLMYPADEERKRRLLAEVTELAGNFPLYRSA